MAYGGSGSAIVLGGLGISEIAAIAGIVVGLAGLLVQVYFNRRNARVNEEFKRREEARQVALHQAHMASVIRGEIE